jgi:hypothetical protein
MLTPLEREQLLRRWEAIEAELDALTDIPAGAIDPAERERRLLEAQDVIECMFAWHFREVPIPEVKFEVRHARP